VRADQQRGAAAARAAVRRADRVDPDEQDTARLRFDEEVVSTLQWHGWSDDAWDPVAEWLAGYGHAVLRGWLFNRTIFEQVAATGYAVERCPPEWLDEEEVISLASDTVVLAIRRFREILRAGKWDSARGASLRTYFVGQCKLQFPNVYRTWRRQAVERHHNPVVLKQEPRTDKGLDPWRRTAEQDELERVLAQMPAHVAQVFQLQQQGYNHTEIAARVDGVADATAVKNIIYRERSRWQNGQRSPAGQSARR